jgi:hypothetical protein
MKGIINFGLFIFFTFSLLVTFAYSLALYEKIKRPTFKNLPTSEFVIIGLFVFGLLVADYFIIKRLIKRR